MEQSTQNSHTYLTGKLLIAMPGMKDLRFHKSVIYVCAHDENGAMGLVINNILPGIRFENLLSELNIDTELKQEIKDIPVLNGGPVEGARGFLVHSKDFEQPDTVSVDETIGVTGTIDALRQVAKGDGPEKMLFILGYAGWSKGQLDQELQQNSWLTVDADPLIIFHGKPEEKWDKATRKLGIDPVMLSSEGGRA